MNEKKYTNGKTNKNDNDVSGQRNTNEQTNTSVSCRKQEYECKRVVGKLKSKWR